jgi:glucose-1-phosphate thymidylyltransferase
LGDGDSLGISIKYEVQPKPEGLAQAFLIGEEFIGQGSVALILGDNIFYGTGLGRNLSNIKNVSGATIFGIKVDDPNRYGVVETSENGKILSIEEKPINPKSNIAVPGLYFFDNTVSKRASSVTKSSRGELEITAVIDSYLNDGILKLHKLEKNTAWMDCGTVNSMNDASNFVRSTEESIGLKVGCIEEVAYRQGWISKEQLMQIVTSLGSNEYSKYLLHITTLGHDNVR